MTEKLAKNINEIYLEFERYKANSNMSGSPLHNELDKWNKKLFSKKLNKLTQDDLSIFNGKAMTTWGNENDFKHFLPRILELTAELKTPYEIWITFEKIELANFKKWNENEKKLINEYLIALFENLLLDETNNAEMEFQDYFSTISNFYPKFTDLISVWEKLTGKAATKHLANLIIREEISLFERNKISGFRDKKENAYELITWLLSDERLKYLQNKFFEFENEGFAEKISWAEQIIVNRKKLLTT